MERFRLITIGSLKGALLYWFFWKIAIQFVHVGYIMTFIVTPVLSFGTLYLTQKFFVKMRLNNFKLFYCCVTLSFLFVIYRRVFELIMYSYFRLDAIYFRQELIVIVIQTIFFYLFGLLARRFVKEVKGTIDSPNEDILDDTLKD